MKKNIAIICVLDGSANSIMPTKMKQCLTEKGHYVELINTININNYIINKNKLNYLNAKIWFLVLGNFTVNVCLTIQERFLKWTRKFFYYYLLKISMYFRSSLLAVYLKNRKYDLIIGESQIDSAYFLKKPSSITLYNCATPWADELYFGNEITKSQYEKFLKLEIEIYRSIDYLSFHSDVYADYVKKYFYKGKNIIKMHTGSEKKKFKAKYSVSPKIVYLGYLGGYWINLPLLSRLSKKYKNLDVYGFPKPPSQYKLNYKGYARPDILQNYQFGLITLSKDKLRREGFSQKHIEYLSYGLPVLVPEWRKNAKKMKGTILYNETNFIELVIKYSKKDLWMKTSQEALVESKNYDWEKVFQPLIKIVNSF